MKRAQEAIHWLEVGAGSRWVRLAAVLAGTLALSVLVAWKQFHGPVSETTLLQADLGRQIARGEGFTTLVNHPQTLAWLQARGVRFDPRRPYPELHHAPLYPLTIAGALRLVPAETRAGLFDRPPVPPDGFGGDYLLLALNLGFLWLAAALAFLLARRLFDPAAGWLAALGLLVSVALWQETVAVNGTSLLMVLVLLAFLLWHRIEAGLGEAEPARAPGRWLFLLGGVGGLLFLAEYSAGAIVLVALGYGVVRFSGRARAVAPLAVALGFAVVAGPWVGRNVLLTGHPAGLAVQNVALKAGDPTAEPSAVRATLSADLPRLDLRKLGNKALTALQEDLKSRLWSGGAMWLGAFFVASWLYTFRSATVNRLRWVCCATLGALLLAQAGFNSGESERHAAVWLAPLLIVFGAGFFFVLLGSHASLSAWPRTVATALLALQALPLLHDVLEPRRLHFHYPPYFPALFQGLRHELDRREAAGHFGLMSDVPAGLAWYGQTRAWAQPPRLRDFYAITLEQPMGGLLLTPRTLDRPFFSELNAAPILPGTVGAVPDRFGEWGGVYAGLLTGSLPRDFPFGPPQKLAENLFVLLNPALPPVRGN